MRARACLKCKEYVLIHPNNIASQKLIKDFELVHMGHNLMTVNLDEIKGQYKRYDLKNDSLKKEDGLSLEIS